MTRVDNIHYAHSMSRQAAQIASDIRRDLLGGDAIDSASIDGMFAALLQKLGLVDQSLEAVQQHLRDVLG